MLPKWHLLFGLALSLILFPFLGWHVLILLAATVLIDFDHYLIYAIKKKDINLKNAYAYLKKLEEKQRNPNFKGKYIFLLCIFHTYEFLFILLVIAFLNKFILLVFLGFIFHMVIDIISTRIEFNDKFFFYYLKALFLTHHILSKDKESFGEIKTAL